MYMLNPNTKRPHNIGIQKPDLALLVTPMEMDTNDRSSMYTVRRERKDKSSKRRSFLVMQSYLRSVDTGILPPFSCSRQFLCSF